MGQKRKRGKSSSTASSGSGGWKAMTIESAEGLTSDDFAGLVGLEELTNYEMEDRGGLKVISYKEVDDVTGAVDDNDDLDDELVGSENQEEPEEEQPKKKKQKKQFLREKLKKKKLKKKQEKEQRKLDITNLSEASTEVLSSDPSLASTLVLEDVQQLAEEDAAAAEVDSENLNQMSAWTNLAVPDHIVRCLQDLQMTKPTPIQVATIPSAIQEREDIYGAAPTGSGKTLAFAIPMVAHIVDDLKDNEDGDGPGEQCLRGLVLTPTRELAVQIKKHIESITKRSNLKTALVVGGLAVQKQQRVLSKLQPDILVATPGRLWDIVNSGAVDYLNRAALAKVKYLVIDEADRMVEKSHFEEAKLLLDLLAQVHCDGDQKRQIFIFSATLTMQKKKDKNQKKQRKSNNEPDLLGLLRLDANELKTVDLTAGGSKSTPNAEQLAEHIIHCMQADKDLYLYYFLLQNPGRTLVFCNSIDCIRRLVNILRFLALSPLAVHSSMQQKRRLMAIERFTSSQNSILIATDVAARGLDIPEVNHVIHYQCPRTADIYVHRSGRTARAHQSGLSLILCDPQEEAFFLKDMFRILHKKHSDLAEYDTNSLTLKRLKERLRLALVCDQLEHQLRKERSNTDWFKEAAKAAEMDDSDAEKEEYSGYLGEATPAAAERAKNSRKLAAYQKQLKALIKQKISIPRI